MEIEDKKGVDKLSRKEREEREIKDDGNKVRPGSPTPCLQPVGKQTYKQQVSM